MSALRRAAQSSCSSIVNCSVPSSSSNRHGRHLFTPSIAGSSASQSISSRYCSCRAFHSSVSSYTAPRSSQSPKLPKLRAKNEVSPPDSKSRGTLTSSRKPPVATDITSDASAKSTGVRKTTWGKVKELALPKQLEPGYIAKWNAFNDPEIQKEQDAKRVNWNVSESSKAWPWIGYREGVDPEIAAYKRVTSKDIVNYKDPPQKMTMLVRDYIADSLYNNNYGYFTKDQKDVSSLKIFQTSSNPSEGFDFNSIKSDRFFTQEVAKKYEEYHVKEKQEDEDGEAIERGVGKQIWHTPTELFKPWYGRAMARCIVQEYKLKHYPYEDLIIYEMGAGNGTLMMNILDYLKEKEPEVYERTNYRIIEISKPLAMLQKKAAKLKHPFVEIVNKSIHDWKEVVYEPCFFIAMEVLDNFAHDMIRFDFKTGRPLQAVIGIDSNDDFHTFYEEVTDPLISSFLETRAKTPFPSKAMSLPLTKSPLLRNIRTRLPFAPNLSQPEYIPTMMFSFLKDLREKLPNHRLLAADFHELKDTIPGVNAPVVQVRLGLEMVPVSQLLVKHGYFDIFFPTNFEFVKYLYDMIQREATSKVRKQGTLAPAYFSSTRNPTTNRSTTKVYSHEKFLEKYGEVSRTKLRDGTNPMLKWYQNASVMF